MLRKKFTVNLVVFFWTFPYLLYGAVLNLKNSNLELKYIYFWVTDSMALLQHRVSALQEIGFK